MRFLVGGGGGQSMLAKWPGFRIISSYNLDFFLEVIYVHLIST